MSEPTADEMVAIVGLAAQVPGAADVDQFWHDLVARREAVRFPSDEELLAAGLPAHLLTDPDHVRAFAEAPDLDMFDADFFGFTPREAAVLDPQIRLFLEVAHTAIENAGYDPHQVGDGTGVYATTGANRYLDLHVRPGGYAPPSAGHMAMTTLSYTDYIATHVAYRFGLRGPAMAVSTACSSSAVAVHLACQALRMGECDLALAGGSEVEVPVGQGYRWHSGGPQSPDGHCRPFDAAADGTVFSSGAAAVVLKRLRDAVDDGDHIWAVIRASAVNNDGAAKAGFSAPGVTGQAAAVREACRLAAVTPADVSYVEAHATGTILGDPIEVAALAKAYGSLGPASAEPIPLSSVKGNIGHLGHAAGVASLVKVALCLAKGERVGTVNFTEANPRLALGETPFVIADAGLAWPRRPDRPRIAGMNSLGIGGTNVHLVVEEAPERAPAPGPAARPQLVVWSARTEPALAEYQRALADRLDTMDGAGAAFADTVGTLQEGRTQHPVRAAVVAGDAGEAAAAIRAGKLIRTSSAGQPRPVVLLFPGQAAQYPRMAAGLYQVDDAFTRTLDSCLELFAELGHDLRGPWLAGADLTDTGLAQPLLFAVQYALARMWHEWGVRPAAVLGHSVGELAAAAVAGVFALPDAARLVAVRAAAMAQLPPGGMLAVAAEVEEVSRRWPDGLPEGVTVAVVNGPGQFVLAGPEEQLEVAAADLAEAGVAHRRLATSHAFHTPWMEPARRRLADEMAGVARQVPAIPLISAATGEWVTEAALDTELWSAQVTRPVRFDQALTRLLAGEARLLLEVGPGRTLSTLVRQHPAAGPNTAIEGLGAGESGEHRAALAAAGTLWADGHAVDWAPVRQWPVRRTPLPGYRYQRARHWLPPRAEPAPPAAVAAHPAGPATGRTAGEEPGAPTPFSTFSWIERTRPRPAASGGGAAAVALLPADEAAALPAVMALQQAGYRLHVARPGLAYEECADEFRVRPDDPEDLSRMIAAVAAGSGPPELLVHGLALPSWPAPDHASVDAQLSEAYHCLAALAQAALRRTHVRRLLVITTRSADVTGVEPLDPVKAALHGTVRTLDQEAPDLDCRLIDVAPGTADAAQIASLAAEIGAMEAPPVVVLRGPGRWVRVELPHHVGAEAPPVRPDGVYLLTGGLGGLGMAVAREMAGTGLRPHLVLVSRGGLPEAGDDPDAARTRARIATLERLGARVRIEACDITDRRAARRLLDRLRAHLGAVHGIVHLAGVRGGGLLVRRGRADAEAVLRPKVQGTLVLAELLADLPQLDFFAAFSSRAATNGLVGSADYAAGNAFLDAYTRTMARAGVPALSVNWPVWHTVGMAARQVPATAGAAGEELRWETVLRVEDSPILDEHRLDAAPVLPGSGVLDLVLRAFRAAVGPAGTPATFTEVVFPQVLDCSRPRRVTVRFRPSGEEWSFQAGSTPADGAGTPVIHATGSVRAGAASPASVTSLEELRKRLDTPLVEDGAPAPRLFTLGPRWRSVRRVTGGADRPGERLVEIALAEPYHADLREHPLHPALLDIATAEVREPARDGIQLPFRYGSLAVFEDLPARFTSHIRRHPRGPGMIVADVDLFGDDGRPLARITDYTMRAVGEAGPARAGDEPAEAPTEGIAPVAGARMFLSLLGGGRHHAQIAVRPHRHDSPLPLASGTPEPLPAPSHGEGRPTGQPPTSSGASPPAAARPGPATMGAGAADPEDLATRAARLWTQVLGIDRFDPDADFFEVGGTSLTAVELIGLVRDEFGIRFSVVTLFDRPTLAGFVAALTDEGAR